jgi:archaellum component FlaC
MLCPFCQAENAEGAKYCGQCGAPLDAIASKLKDYLQSDLRSEVERAIEARLKDQKLVELDTSLAIAERLTGWAKLFAACVGIPLSALVLLLGFLGIRSYQDFENLTQRARADVTKELGSAKAEAETATGQAREASSQVQMLNEKAKELVQGVAEVSQKLAEISVLSSQVEELKSRAVDVEKQLSQASALTNEVKGLTSKVSELESRFSKIGRVTIIADGPNSVQSLSDLLTAHGAEITVVSPDQLARLGPSNPEIVIIAAETGRAWRRQPKWALQRVFESYKVLGIGQGGAQLFSTLGLEINDGQTWHGKSDSPVVIESAALLAGPLKVSAPGGSMQVAEPGSDSLGVYDEGSPDILGIEGIARESADKNHWAIARQGNYVLWGIDAPPDRFTESGRALFVNLLISHKLNPEIPLSQARRKHEYIAEGVVSEQINEQFPSRKYYFRPRQAGRLTAKLSWTPADQSLALILIGSAKGSDRPLAREDRASPIEIGLDVTQDQVTSEGDWFIEVTNFQRIGSFTINYSLELSSSRAPSTDK